MINVDRKAAAEAVKKHGSVRKAARALGLPYSTLQLRLRGIGPKKKSAAPASTTGRSLQDFRASHDKDFIVPRKIREALKALNGGWDYESQFAKLAGVSLTDLANYRDTFSDYLVTVKRDGKRAWAGTAAVAAKMREMVR